MLKLPSNPRNVCKVESYLKHIVEKYRLSPEVYGDILISLTEAVNNAIIHGNCQDESKLVKIHLQKEKVYTLQSFKEILSSLPESDFVRVHKSYIVSLRKISSIQKNKIFIGEKAIPIGSTFKEEFLKQIKNRG